MHTIFHRYTFGAMLMLAAGLWCACSKSNSGQQTPVKVDATVQPLQFMLDNNFSFSKFDTLMKKSGYMDSLTNGRMHTLFVPDNNAFTNANISVDSLLALPKDSLRQFVGNHVFQGAVTTDLIPQTITNPMVASNGQTLYFSKPIITSSRASTPDQVKALQQTLHVNGIKVTLVDQRAVDGVLHVMQFPLRTTVASVGGYLVSHPEYSNFVAALRKFNMFDQLNTAGPYTVFAPNNDAMINNGITMDMINSDTFDVQHYQPYLFSANWLPTRTYMTDFSDAPLPNDNSGNPTGYTKYGTIQYSFADYNPVLRIAVTNYTSWLGPGYTIYNNVGPNAQAFEQDQQPALNGVIMPTNTILVYPDSVYLYTPH